MRQLEETYAGSGLVRLEYKHFPFIGPESARAAEASECALEQGQFWPYHDTLYLNQRGENAGGFGDDALLAFAAALGLDEVAFEECLDSGRYEDQVNSEWATASQRGVTTTPTTVINGQAVTGAVDFGRLQAIIESELARLSG